MHHPGADLSTSPCFSTIHWSDFGSLPTSRNRIDIAHCHARNPS